MQAWVCSRPRGGSGRYATVGASAWYAAQNQRAEVRSLYRGQGDDLTAPEKTGTSARCCGRGLRFPKSRRGNGGDGYHVTRPQQRRIPMPHFQLQRLHIAEISRVV